MPVNQHCLIRHHAHGIFPPRPLHATAGVFTLGSRVCGMDESSTIVLLSVQYCDGGPLDQAMRKSRFKRTMVRPIALHACQFWS